MNIKLDKLRSFVLVADEGNLTRAANRRHTTPSAVSEHLRQLEDHFGLPLFQRNTRGMALTDAGRRLLPAARQVLRQVVELDDIARALRCDQPTPLSFALNAPPEYLKVDQLLRTAARDRPEVALELITSSSYMILDQVRAGEVDMGFVYGDIFDEQILSLRLAPIRVSVVGPVDSGLARFPIDSAERRALPWIWPANTCPLANMLPDILEGGREQANTVSSSIDEHSTLSMIRAGLGYGLVEHELASHWAGRGSVKVYDDPLLTINLNLLVRRDRLDREAVSAVVRLVERIWQPEVTEPAPAGTESVNA
ncbi:LysR family transcriptional regulator [Marinobacter sp. JSM 1782161]|uniref:LysR family transcriptional regulator n=1 Tax=Marinobacter sp. JSM 1782161 TaxID=2685906 RepID=UPI001402292E|nr:LysR family transcriptional regulator [Marinobacter sp. JSM 1782161]